MTGAMVPFDRCQLAPRELRRLGRTLSSIEQRRRTQLAAVEAQAEIEAAKVDAVAFVAQVAMHDVALLSQLEVQLSQLVPAATSRLQAIGDISALALAEVVTNTARRLR